MRGKLLRMNGKTIEAIKTLEQAKALYDKQTETANDRLDRWEVVDLLAKAYVETNQIGRGKQLLCEMLERFPTYDPARVLLITLLMRESNVEEARPHIEYLERRKSSDPEVIKMKLWLLSKSGAADQGDAD